MHHAAPPQVVHVWLILRSSLRLNAKDSPRIWDNLLKTKQLLLIDWYNFWMCFLKMWYCHFNVLNFYYAAIFVQKLKILAYKWCYKYKLCWLLLQLLLLFLNITYANTMRSISPLPSFSVSLFQTNLVCIGCLGHSLTTIAVVPIFRVGWFKNGHDLGLRYFVKESKICNIFAWWGKGDNRRELISPQNLIWQIRGANLASGRGWFNCSTHDYQEFKICQVWVCPTSTCWNRIS